MKKKISFMGKQFALFNFTRGVVFKVSLPRVDVEGGVVELFELFFFCKSEGV